jgi:hypothetical protein
MVVMTEPPTQSGRAFNALFDRSPRRVSVALAPKRCRAKGTFMQLPSILQGESLTRLLQGAAAGAVATMIIGFQWSGWTLGSTADKQVKDAEQATVVRVLAPICVDKFQQSADASTNLDELKKAESWRRNEIIEKAGWTKFPGSEPDGKVAEACARLLSQVK